MIFLFLALSIHNAPIYYTKAHLLSSIWYCAQIQNIAGVILSYCTVFSGWVCFCLYKSFRLWVWSSLNTENWLKKPLQFAENRGINQHLWAGLDVPFASLLEETDITQPCRFLIGQRVLSSGVCVCEVSTENTSLFISITLLSFLNRSIRHTPDGRRRESFLQYTWPPPEESISHQKWREHFCRRENTHMKTILNILNIHHTHMKKLLLLR